MSADGDKAPLKDLIPEHTLTALSDMMQHEPDIFDTPAGGAEARLLPAAWPRTMYGISVVSMPADAFQT